MIKWFALLLIAGIASAQNPAAPGPRSDSRLVVVDVLVRNRIGPVTGLTKDDFTLTDKGKAQKIEVFAATPDRDPNAKESPLSTGVGANRLDRRGVQVDSAIVILYDRLNTPAADQAYTRKLVLDVLSSMKDTDRFAFCSLGRQLTLVTDFTEDPAALIRAAARLNAATPPPADPVEQATQKALEDSLSTQQDIDMLYRVATTSRAFQSITRHLSGLPGRKGVAWITRSFPLTFGADINRRGETEKELNAATSLLQEENIALYPINPGGVGNGQGDQSTVSADRPAEGRLMPGSNASISTSGTLSDISTMENIADATGGVAYYNINEITSKVREVMADAALAYTLGYYPDTKMDGRPHDLGVKVAKKNETIGATLRFRKRYLANKQDDRAQTPPVPQLAGEPLDATAIKLAAYAQPDPQRPTFQGVDVSVNAADLRMEQKGDHWTGAFELGLFIEGDSSASGSVQTINLNLTDDQLKKALGGGLVVHSAIDTKGQPAKLRVAVRDRTSGAGGAVRLPMMVQ